MQLHYRKEQCWVESIKEVKFAQTVQIERLVGYLQDYNSKKKNEVLMVSGIIKVLQIRY